MRVEILRELEADDPKLELPWASPRDPRVRYVDLNRFPEMIDGLSECRRYPALAGLLRKMHLKGCALRTAKCGVWVTTKLADDERLDFPVPIKVGSYLDLVFNSSRLNSCLETHLFLGKRLERLLRSCRVQAQAEVAVRRCLFHPKERWGFYVTIFVHAYGATRAEAKKEWSRAMDCLGDGLLVIGTKFAARVPSRRHMRSTDPTVAR